MPYGNPGNPSEDDMYGDAKVGAPPKGREPKKEEGEDQAQSYPLPIEVLEGKDFEVGDEVVLRITEKRDNQIFVTYAPAKEQEKKPMKEEAGGEPEMAGGMAGGGGGGDKGMGGNYY